MKVPNTDKCVWSPSQQLDRLRIRWDLKQCVLPVPDRRLSDLYELIILVLENSTAVKVRTLAKVSGKIIAMSPALGFATQVMTRCIFLVLNLKDDWNQIFNINYHNDCIRELVFWKLNIFDFKPTSLLRKPLILIFLLMPVITDSWIHTKHNICYAHVLVKYRSYQEFDLKRIKSQIIEFVIFSMHVEKHMITFHTDNQNDACIVL